MNIYFTADTHLNHPALANIRAFKFGLGFKSTKEHDEFIITNWNSVVRKGDEVYLLGDFCFGSHEIVRSMRTRLNGKIHLIMGSHDRANKIHNLPELFASISDLKTIKIDAQKIVLCHYAMRVWAYSHYGSWHLYGHSHRNLEGWGKSFDVGVDCWNYYPISIDKVVEEMEKRPDNFNLIRK